MTYMFQSYGFQVCLNIMINFNLLRNIYAETQIHQIWVLVLDGSQEWVLINKYVNAQGIFYGMKA